MYPGWHVLFPSPALENCRGRRHEASHCWYILSVMRRYRSHVLIIMISLLCLYQQSIFRFDWIWFLYEQEHKERWCRARCKVGSQNKSKILISQNYAIQIQNIRTINLQVLQPKADEARHLLPQVLCLRAPQLRQRHRPDLLHRHVPRIPVPRVRKVGKHFFLNFDTTQCYYKCRDVLTQMEEPINVRDDPLNRVFPKVSNVIVDSQVIAAGVQLNRLKDRWYCYLPQVAKCSFQKFGPSGSLQKHDALCVLPLNIINEKVNHCINIIVNNTILNTMMIIGQDQPFWRW